MKNIKLLIILVMIINKDLCCINDTKNYKKGYLKILDNESSSSSNKSSIKSEKSASPKPSDKAIPFSSIEGCGVIDLNEESV